MLSALLLCIFVPAAALVFPLKGIHGWSTNHYLWAGPNNYKCITTTSDRSRCNKLHNRNPSTYLKLSAIDESTTDGLVQIIHEPDTDFLSSKGVLDWPTWGCPVSKFPWSYSDTEVCYLIKGKVIVTPVIKNNNNSNGPQVSPKPVTIVAGDYVTLPAGLSCTWDVIEAVEKHYTFL
jgi:uncharacterized protein